MSNFSGHAIGGLTTATIATTVTFFVATHSPLVLATCFVSTFLFSLFPDIDIKSTSSKIFYLFFAILSLYFFIHGVYKYSAVVGLISMIPQFFSHRGLFHSIFLAPIVCAWPFVFGSYIGLASTSFVVVWIAGMIGFYTHLFLDR